MTADVARESGSLRVSIIIPCRNERDHIEACLRSVLAQEDPGGGFEVLIADGLSSDGTREIIGKFADSDARVRLIDNPGRTAPTGLNRGIAAARGQIIIRKDAHTDYPANYIRTCVAVLEKTGADNVGGIWEIIPTRDSAVARAIAGIQGHWFGVGNARFRTKGGAAGPADTVPYGCFRREVFDRVGVFDERLVRGQDLELNARIRKSGGIVYLDPEIHCFYHPPATLGDFAHKQFRNGLWVIYQAALTSFDTIGARHLVPLAFVLALVAGLLLAPFAPALGVAIFLAALVPYVILSGFVGRELSRVGAPNQGAPVPWYLFIPILFVNHSAYGCGSFWGLLTSWRLDK